MVPIGGVSGSGPPARKPVNAAKNVNIYEDEYKWGDGKKTKVMLIEMTGETYSLDTVFDKKGKVEKCTISKHTSSGGVKTASIGPSSDKVIDLIRPGAGADYLSSSSDDSFTLPSDKKGFLNAAEKTGRLLAKEVYNSLLLAGKRTEDPQMRAIAQFIVDAGKLAHE